MCSLYGDVSRWGRGRKQHCGPQVAAEDEAHALFPVGFIALHVQSYVVLHSHVI